MHSQGNAGDEGGRHGSLKAKEREPELRNPHVHDLMCLTSLDGLDPPALHPTALDPHNTLGHSRWPKKGVSPNNGD